jgi:hypothetical protein
VSIAEHKNKIMPPLEQISLSSSLHSVGSTTRTNNILSLPRNILTAAATTVSSSTKVTTDSHCIELRTAKDGCIGAMTALLHYLSVHGVSSCSIQEIHQSILHQQQQYDTILRNIIKYYLVCIPSETRYIEYETIHMLLLGCWQALARYAQIQHQLAYQHYKTLRFGHHLQPCTKNNNNNANSNTTSINHKTISSMHRVISSSSSSMEIEKALQHQIQMAEYVCTCQKEIILCNRSYDQRQQHQGQ